MIILDTNVLSALMQKTPDPKVVDWLDKQPRMSIWTTSVTLLEVRFGLQVMPLGRRRALLMHAFEELLANQIGGRVTPFDSVAALQAGDLMAKRHKSGNPGDLRDTMIAGIVLACHATLATRNIRHFDDLSVPLIDPWGAE